MKSEYRCTVAFYCVSDSDSASGKIIHQARKRSGGELNELVRGANKILQPQANVIFEIVEHLNSGDGGTEPFDSVTLVGNFHDKVSDNIFGQLRRFIHPFAHFHVFFVWAYKGNQKVDERNAGTQFINKNTGLCVFEDHIPYGQEAQVLAHEAVHFLLKRNDFSSDAHKDQQIGDLMYPRSGASGFERGTRLGRIYADIINP